MKTHNHYPDCPVTDDPEADCECNDIEDREIAQAEHDRAAAIRFATARRTPADLIRSARAKGLLSKVQQYP